MRVSRAAMCEGDAFQHELGFNRVSERRIACGNTRLDVLRLIRDALPGDIGIKKDGYCPAPR